MGERGPLKGSKVVPMRGGSKKKDQTQNKTEKPKAGRPKVPAWVPPEGRTFVRKLLPELEAKGLLEEVDAGSIAAMGSVYAILAMAMKEIAKDGVKVPDPEHPVEEEVVGEALGETPQKQKKPAIRKHPLISVVMAANEKLAAWSKEFGLTPAARARLNIQPPKGASKLGAFINGKKY